MLDQMTPENHQTSSLRTYLYERLLTAFQGIKTQFSPILFSPFPVQITNISQNPVKIGLKLVKMTPVKRIRRINGKMCFGISDTCKYTYLKNRTFHAGKGKNSEIIEKYIKKCYV